MLPRLVTRPQQGLGVVVAPCSVPHLSAWDPTMFSPPSEDENKQNKISIKVRSWLRSLKQQNNLEKSRTRLGSLHLQEGIGNVQNAMTSAHAGHADLMRGHQSVREK